VRDTVGDAVVDMDALCEPLTQRDTVGERDSDGLPEKLLLTLVERDTTALAVPLPVLLPLPLLLAHPLVVALRHRDTLLVVDRLGDSEALKVPVMLLVRDGEGVPVGEALRQRVALPHAESDGEIDGVELKHSIGEELGDPVLL
jgi:hypothetical protein